MLKECGIDLETFDRLPRKRIDRILKLKEEMLQQQQKLMEEERKKQEREAARRSKYK